MLSAFSWLGSFTTPLKLCITIWATTRINRSNMYMTDFPQYAKAIPFLPILSLSCFYFFSYNFSYVLFYHLFYLSSLFSFLFYFPVSSFSFPFFFSLFPLLFIFFFFFCLAFFLLFLCLRCKTFFFSASTRAVSSSSWEYTLHLISLTLNSLSQSENEINFLNFLQLLPERPKSKSLWSRFYT